MKSPGLKSLETSRNQSQPASPAETSVRQPLRRTASSGNEPGSGPGSPLADPTSPSDPSLSTTSGLNSESTSPESQPGNPALGTLRPLNRDQLESMSPHEQQEHRLAYGLQLLAQSPEYRNLLMFPADSYSQEIVELIGLEAEWRERLASPTLGQEEHLFSEKLETQIRSADMERQDKAREQHVREHLEGAIHIAEQMGRENLWAIPAPNPNATWQQKPPYGLIWATLPEGTTPLPNDPWKGQDWVTGWRTPVVTITMDPFPVEPELWSRVGVGAVLKRRCYKLEPAQAED